MYQSITITDFEQLAKKENITVLDVREQTEYIAGHIKEAQHIPLNTIPDYLSELEKGKHYYVICHSGKRSEAACEYLSAEGYQVTNIMGGMSSWRNEVAYGAPS